MEELDLKELFNIFWGKKVQIILLVAIFVLIGVIYTIGFTTPMYSSYTTLILSATKNEQATGTITANDIALNSKLAPTYGELVKSKEVLRTVITNLKIEVNEDTLRNNVKVTAVDDTGLIEITVSNENAEYSAQIANEIAKVFIEKVKELYNINNMNVLDKAEVSTSPSNINHKKDVLIFACIGAVIAGMYVLISNMFDTTIKTSEEIEKSFGVPVLITIPLIEKFEVENEKGGKR